MLYSIQRDWGPNSNMVRIVTDSTIEEIIAEGWLADQNEDIIAANNGEFSWSLTDFVLVTIINPMDAESNPGKAIYSQLFSLFADYRSLNPNVNPIPNLQNITAHAGGGQADATQLNLGINVVTVVATAGDSVKLPTDVLGQSVVVSNRGANQLALYPSSGDSINQLAANLPIFIFPGETYLLYGSSVTNWSTVNISPVFQVTDNITAHAGGGQADATILNIGVSVVTTVASANDSVKIPTNFLGQAFIVHNRHATNAIEVFPPTGANFYVNGVNPSAANAAVTLAPKFANLIVGTSATELLIVV